MATASRACGLFLPLLLFVPFTFAQEPAKPAPPQGTEAQKKPVDEKAEIDKLITDGLAAWRAGDEQKAVDLLQSAAGKIQARAARGLAAFLPKKAEGWTFEEPQVDSGSWGSGDGAFQWSNAEVGASHEGDEKSVRVQITNSPQVFQGLQAMVTAQAQMAAMLKQQGMDIASKQKDGFQMLTIVEGDSASAWLVGKRMAVSITLENGDRPTLESVVGWIDLAGLKKLDGK